MLAQIWSVLKDNAPALLAVLGSIAAALFGLLKTKIGAAITEHVKSPIVNTLLDRLFTLVAIKAHDLEATLVPQLKAATADGKLSKEDIVNLKDILVAELKRDFASWDTLKYLAGWNEAQLTNMITSVGSAEALKASAASAAKAAAGIAIAAAAPAAAAVIAAAAPVVNAATQAVTAVKDITSATKTAVDAGHITQDAADKLVSSVTQGVADALAKKL